MNKLAYPFIILLIVSSCASDTTEEKTFPPVQNVNILKKTDFVATLETKFDADQNSIYGATIPFAWDEIRSTIGQPLSEFSSNKLKELNATESYLNVLRENEYSTSVEIDGNQISAKAYFKKSLPFEEPLTRFGQPLKFGNSDVESFGFWGSHHPARINYFHSEEEFSVSLFPKNEEHEIILVMSQNPAKTLSFEDCFTHYNEQTKQSDYIPLADEDHVNIPLIEFNLSKDYTEFIGSTFASESTDYEVTEAYQRNAFILNEKGAEVESEALVAVTESAEEFQKPKSMIFDQPFYVFLKRQDANHPYFAVYIANAELLYQSEL